MERRFTIWTINQGSSTCENNQTLSTTVSNLFRIQWFKMCRNKAADIKLEKCFPRCNAESLYWVCLHDSLREFLFSPRHRSGPCVPCWMRTSRRQKKFSVKVLVLQFSWQCALQTPPSINGISTENIDIATWFVNCVFAYSWLGCCTLWNVVKYEKRRVFSEALYRIIVKSSWFRQECT